MDRHLSAERPVQNATVARGVGTRPVGTVVAPAQGESFAQDSPPRTSNTPVPGANEAKGGLRRRAPAAQAVIRRRLVHARILAEREDRPVPAARVEGQRLIHLAKPSGLGWGGRSEPGGQRHACGRACPSAHQEVLFEGHRAVELAALPAVEKAWDNCNRQKVVSGRKARDRARAIRQGRYKYGAADTQLAEAGRRDSRPTGTGRRHRRTHRGCSNLSSV